MTPLIPRLRALQERATTVPWVLGYYDGQAESNCQCARKGKLLAKRDQTIYPGKGPFHIHESDFHANDHLISGPLPDCNEVAGQYDIEEGGIVRPEDAAYIAALVNAAPSLFAVVEAAEAYVAAECSPSTACDAYYQRVNAAWDVLCAALKGLMP